MLGGTGAMGSHLTNILAENGDEVYVTSRNTHNKKLKINYIVGNAQDDSFLKEILHERWDVIIDFMSYSTATFKRRVEHLLNATDQYVYLSSARVYANSEEPITESSPRLLDVTTDNAYISTDEYALKKARQENVLFNSNKNNWTIIRPYITYSEKKLQLGVLEKEAWLYRALHNRPIVFSADINSKITTLTYGLDVAKGINAIIGKERAFGEAFHITSEDTIVWKDVSEIYTNTLEKHLGYRPEIILQNIQKFTQCHSANYQIEYDRLYNRVFDNGKINKFIDTSEFISAAKGLKKCVEEFLNSPTFLTIDWRKEAIKDKQVAVKTPFSELPNMKQKIKYSIYRNLKL
jgi:nucleoside-diphosphate-sugar epimerase